MASFFRYPYPLLHSYAEPQWLPPTEGQKTSSLDRLEEEELAHFQRVKKCVLPENIPDPIGIDDSKKFALHSTQQPSALDQETSWMQFLTGATIGSPKQQFWQKYQQHASRDNRMMSEHEKDEASYSALSYGARLRSYNFQGPAETSLAHDMQAEPEEKRPATTASARTAPTTAAMMHPNSLEAGAVAYSNKNNNDGISFSHQDMTLEVDDDDEDMEEDWWLARVCEKFKTSTFLLSTWTSFFWFIVSPSQVPFEI